jgi:toxin CptA
MTSAPAIGFEYRPARWLPWLLGLVAALALLGVALCALPVWLKVPVSVAVVWMTWRAVRRWAHSPVFAAGWGDADQGWTLQLASHHQVPATLLSFRILGPFILLRLHTDVGLQVLLLAPDNSDADLRRRLRMRLATVEASEALPRI